MSSYPKRDPQTDPLISPENSVLLIIDYQPIQITSINSMDKRDLIMNMGVLAELAQAFNLPVILSTVNVRTGANKDTIPQIKDKLGDIVSYDRTTINAWEDKEFYEAVHATNRKKILMAALWTEACLTFPTIDAIREGFEVYPVVDCVGGTSVIAHECGLRRVEQAGAHLTSLAQLACELQRDWNRQETKEDFVRIMEEARWFPNLNK
ncbi:hydrolase [Prevotella sp. 10(H)]|uniref:hydrolase n=1 Tax=Prevotella sp. 10(H) TaxID=1158294 RepID=UPI0004A6F442|nr:hydrolase [Prevotella sp. 10(H)]